jgi:3-oxoacyl-[acyl-carrier protein] reductase
MESGLEGARVLVSGGAGGIGTATCRAFAAEGARVAVHYHRAREAAETLAADLGGVALAADLRRETDADRLVPAAVEALGGLDVCVANAGTWPEDDLPLWELSLERWNETVVSNLTVTFLTARAFLRHVAATRRGALVLVGSTAGRFGEAGHADYAAAKAAVQQGLLLSLKNEVARLGGGVRVNAVAPGWTATPMTREALRDVELVRLSTATMPLKKVATADDIARSVVVLASDRLSGHVTGQLITVAGGMEGRLVP